ncbi:MAG: hypothetical protein EXS03_08075 [Phycisphaerales bacterium]|nr:hypothetical protein [Phycisphaerales bacterium]
MSPDHLVPAVQNAVREPGAGMGRAAGDPGHRSEQERETCGPRRPTLQLGRLCSHTASLSLAVRLARAPYDDRVIVSLAGLVLVALMPQGSQRAVPAPQSTVAQSDAARHEAARSIGTVRERVDKGRRVRALAEGEEAPSDHFQVEFLLEGATLLDPKARSGRIIVFLKALDSRATGAPADGPFFSDPQPIGSVRVDALAPGMTIKLSSQSVWWPEAAPRLLDGEYEVQAVFDPDTDGAGHRAAGNLISPVARIGFHRDSVDEVRLALTRRIDSPAPPDHRNVMEIEVESPLLSTAASRRVHHRASMVFPRQYGDLNARRRIWPTVYVIAPAGMRHELAKEIATQLASDALGAVRANAVYVVLDQEGPYGSHGFIDSQANGPRGTALVTEFIPYLEERFRLVREPQARVVQGHSTGGWAAVFLAVRCPAVFSAAFASAPQPLDFSKFELVDLYRDENLFFESTATETAARAAYREVLGPSHDLVPMVLEEELGMERAISPSGDSGGQWDAWAAMFSPIDASTNAPRRLCDPLTGVIDPQTVEAWSTWDLVRRIQRDPERLGALVASRVRILVGDRDSFYLERSALALRDTIDACARVAAEHGREFPGGPGYIEIVRGATHETILPLAQVRFGREIQEHFRRAKLHD